MASHKMDKTMKHQPNPQAPGGMRRRGPALIILLGIAMASLTGTAQAQTRTLTGTVIAGGGSTSSGGKFIVAGAVGKPDSSTMKLQGSKFTATGGQAPIIVLQTPGAPRLSVAFSEGTATLSWPPEFVGWTLQQKSALGVANGWMDSTGVVNNQLTISMPTGYLFFRLQKELSQ